MTAKEALEYFKRRKEQIKMSGRAQQAEDLAIKALEKQIPKKPINCSGRDWYLCPNCLRTIKKRIEDSDHDIKFCPFCGQRLKWGD